MAFPGRPVLQIGMDTPQIRPALLTTALERLTEHEAVFGPALDGGWWALGLRDPRYASGLRDVPMSTDDTGRRTLAALRGAAYNRRSCPCCGMSTTGRRRWRSRLTYPAPGSRTLSRR
ncbi:DUF2064 domain-containing protein [Micromonospora arida]|uniref:TIGR04282 family arsenosugar biosynthesis glycosyltransferase n=1 Tax=Micromonospora arida TaxID=2203715 RepID=UPI0036B84A43